MNFPELITVIATDTATATPVPNVALVLELKAKFKNNYSVGPVITDSSGKAKFTRHACELAIDRAQQMFVMDYSGDLRSCLPPAKICLHPPDCIAAMIRNYKDDPEFWGLGFEDPVGLFNALRSIRNPDFLPSSLSLSEEVVLSHPSVVLPLQRR